MITAEGIASALEGRRYGSYWMARCPAHDDQNPSLSISDGNNGTVLFHCFAGCEQEKVLNALRSRGLWPDATPGQRLAAERREHETKCNHVEIVAAIAESDIAAGREWNEEDRQTYEQAKTTLDPMSAKIVELAELSPIEYERRREKAAQDMGIRVSVLDSEVDQARKKIKGEDKDVSGTRLVFEEPEPWSEPVDGAELLEELAAAFRQYVVLLTDVDVALALWVLHTYAHDTARISPLLALTSPEKRCGKTTVLSLLQLLTKRPLSASNISPAALFRAIERWHPTLLIDEADTFLKHNDELRGILNAAHTRELAFVLRTVGDDHEPRQFNTWAPKAIALIGDLPFTLADRAIVLPMRRKRPDESVERLRLDRRGEHQSLVRRMVRLVQDHHAGLLQADPEVPKELHDRAADNWRPLLAIADLVGGDWPKRARKAAMTLTDPDDNNEAAGVMLLADIKKLFDERQVDRIASAELEKALGEMEHRPWPEWKHGKPITVRQIARLLNPFGIRPKTIRIEDATPKGYERDSFTDAFSRYLPPNPSATAQQTSDDTGFGSFQTATDQPNVADEKSAEPLLDKHCCGVADEKGGIGDANDAEPWSVEL